MHEARDGMSIDAALLRPYREPEEIPIRNVEFLHFRVGRTVEAATGIAPRPPP